MTAARRFVVRGAVQGVFFRDGTRTRARELGLAGWVRNAGDGTVEVHAEGTADALPTLAGWLAEGPPRARVEGVDARDAEPEGGAGFVVR